MHIESGRQLYGGALQVLYLLQGLAAEGVENVLLCRPNAALAEHAHPYATIIQLPMSDVDLRLIGRLVRILCQHQPDVVHLHSRIGADVMGGLAARWCRLPVVHTRRVDNPEPRWQVALKYRLYDQVIAISEGIAEVLRAQGVPEHRLCVVRSALDTTPYQQPCARATLNQRLGLNLDPDALLIGVVAQLIPRKGHQVLLAALPEVFAKEPRAQVLLFGQGAQESSLRAQIAASGLQQQVHLCGFRDDLSELLPCLQLLVHPALREGLGIALLQASAAGVPIITSRVGGIPEAVRDGINGYLVPPGSVSDLSQAVASLLADPTLRQRLGDQGRVLVKQQFAPAVMVQGNLAVYQQIIRNRAARDAP